MNGKNGKIGPKLPGPNFPQILKIPNTPNKMKIILDNFSIVEAEILEPSHLPKNIAIESLATIPQIEPQISGTLYKGYSKPRPMEARKVLSPSSPIAIVRATINTQFLVKEAKNFIIRDLGVDSVFSSTESAFFDFKKPAIPKIKKVQ